MKAKTLNAYKKLKQRAEGLNRNDTLTLSDLIIISVLCNKRFSPPTSSTAHKANSAHYRILNTRKVIKELDDSLAMYSDNYTQNVKSADGTLEAQEEAIVRSADVMLRMVFISLENAIGVLATIPNYPYSFASLLELTMDNAFLEQNFAVRTKPILPKPKTESEGE